MKVCTLLIAVLAASAARAAPARTCAEMIDGLQAYLEAHPETSGTRRQTKDAQLMHQPTLASVAKAKMEAREHLADLLARAKAQQAASDPRGCRDTLADVERMVKP